MEMISSQFIRVIKKHYLLQMSQKDIAVSEKLSTATISRMLKKAVDNHYVTFHLHLPVMNHYELETEIKTKYQLEQVTVVNADIDSPEIIGRDVSAAVAPFLNQILKPGDILGIPWGTTMDTVASYLIPKVVPDLKIVSLHGSVTCNTSSSGAESVIRRFADNYHAQGYTLPVPSRVGNSETARVLLRDSNVRSMMDLIEQTTVLMFSVGRLSPDSVLIKGGYFTEGEYQGMLEEGYVGDICSRHYLADGSYRDGELYNRIMAIGLETILRKRIRIGVVMDRRKALALKGALAGHYITHLFLDEYTARALLNTP